MSNDSVSLFNLGWGAELLSYYRSTQWKFSSVLLNTSEIKYSGDLKISLPVQMGENGHGICIKKMFGDF